MWHTIVRTLWNLRELKCVEVLASAVHILSVWNGERLIVRMITEELNIYRETVRLILTENMVT
jgi:hypothetical protein